MDRRLAIGSLLLGAIAASSRTSHARHTVRRIRLKDVGTILADDKAFSAYIYNMWLLRDLLILLEAGSEPVPLYSKDRKRFANLIQLIEQNRESVRTQIENGSAQLPDLSDVYPIAEQIEVRLDRDSLSDSADSGWGTLVLTFVVCNCILIIADEGSNLFCGCYPFSEWRVCE
jgi:hypothetical protein